MSGELLFPKSVRKKKRMQHKASILGSTKGICYLCDKLYGDRRYKYTELHHIMFGGGKRKDSEELGLIVDLCRMHHREGKEAVHNNAEIRNLLCKEAQKAFEQTHTRQEWMERGFKNYLDADKEAAEELNRQSDVYVAEGSAEIETGKENAQVAEGSAEIETGKENTQVAAGSMEIETGRENAYVAAGSVKTGDYVGYIWNENIEYGYVLDYGPGDTVWVGEEADAWARRLVETGRIFR